MNRFCFSTGRLAQSLVLGLVVVFSLGVGLAGCTSVSVSVPDPQVEVPQVPGRTGGIALKTGIVPGQEVDFTEDASARPPVLSDPQTSLTGNPMAGAAMGITQRMQVGIDFSSNGESGCAGVEGKFQILGAPRLSARAGDVPLAIYGGYNSCSTSQSGDQSGLFGPGGFPWKASANVNDTDVGATIGYQSAKLLLLYLGAAYGSYRGHIDDNQGVSTDGSSQGGSYSYAANGSAETAAFGLNWGGQAVWLNTQAAYTHFDWDTRIDDGLHFGVLLGVGF